VTDSASTPPTGTTGPRERVLFVDDEPRVLDGLRRMLRPMRDLWEMEFVSSAREALEVVRNGGVTVLITDMQMPDMDGEALLDAVTVESPGTVRIVLTGHSDAEYLYRSANKAHQYLTKPCQSATLTSVIEQACALRNLLADEGLRRAVSRMKIVPSPPQVYRDLLRELENDECSLQKVGDMISADVGLSSSVLRIVNSAWLALNRSIKDMSEAVLILGIEAIKTLVLSSHVFDQLDSASRSRLVVDISAHSLQVAQFSKRIASAEHSDPTLASQAFTAGMMHEVGLMVLAVNEPDAVDAAFRLSLIEKIPLLEAERRLLKATHSQIGAYLLGLWGLPSPIIEAVAFLGEPRASLQGAFSPLCAVHVADSLVHANARLRVRAPELDTAFLQRLHLRHRLEAWDELRCEPVRQDSPR
jgi:HD-like signal output (HDOD) protein